MTEFHGTADEPELTTPIVRLMQSCERGDLRFPSTEVFNETWMLRVLLDAMEGSEGLDHPLKPMPGARWFSEARLKSPFGPRDRYDKEAEGPTRADAVVGHFDFEGSSRTGVVVSETARQFVVIEAKMFSPLSRGTRNAETYGQAARIVACMAKALKNHNPLDGVALGFYVVAPKNMVETHRSALRRDSLREAICDRVARYKGDGKIVDEVDRLLCSPNFEGTCKVLSWDECIDAVACVEPERGRELTYFYERCLEVGRKARPPMTG